MFAPTLSKKERQRERDGKERELGRDPREDGKKRETKEKNEGKEKRRKSRRRSDGVINDRVFNTLYGLAYKLRAVHRSSWQRINGRGAEHGADLSLLLSAVRLLSSFFFLDSFVPPPSKRN